MEATDIYHQSCPSCSGKVIDVVPVFTNAKVTCQYVSEQLALQTCCQRPTEDTFFTLADE